MLFTISWKHHPTRRNATQDRFMATGGPAPEGMTMHARYHNVDGSGGFAVIETDDAVALATLANDWSDLLELNITPVANDEVMGSVIQSAAS